jgi:hypothetical protein
MRTYIEQAEKIIELIEKHNAVQQARRKKVLTSMMVLGFCIVLSSSTVIAYTLSGGDFFKQFFSHKTELRSKSSDYMDVAQLNSIESTTVGTAIEDDILKVDIMGIVNSGNTSEIMLKFTAKQMDSVLYKTKIPLLQNYRFHEDNEGTLLESTQESKIEYIYSDKDDSLAANQFEILYTLISADGFRTGSYDLILKDFGYYNTDSASKSIVFQSLYNSAWTVTIKMDNKNDNSKTKMIAANIVSGNFHFTIDTMQITPFTCSINCSYGAKNEYSRKQFQAFSQGVKDTEIILRDGTILTQEDFTLSWGSCENSHGNPLPMYVTNITFHVPIRVNDVKSVKIFDREYE